MLGVGMIYYFTIKNPIYHNKEPPFLRFEVNPSLLIFTKKELLIWNHLIFFGPENPEQNTVIG